VTSIKPPQESCVY